MFEFKHSNNNVINFKIQKSPRFNLINDSISSYKRIDFIQLK